MRIDAAAVFTVSATAADLAVDGSWWSDIRRQRTVATCSEFRVLGVPEAPNSASTRYVRVSFQRTSRDGLSGGIGVQQVTESRVLQLVDGRWRVAGLFEGG